MVIANEFDSPVNAHGVEDTARDGIEEGLGQFPIVTGGDPQGVGRPCGDPDLLPVDPELDPPRDSRGCRPAGGP